MKKGALFAVFLFFTTTARAEKPPFTILAETQNLFSPEVRFNPILEVYGNRMVHGSIGVLGLFQVSRHQQELLGGLSYQVVSGIRFGIAGGVERYEPRYEDPLSTYSYGSRFAAVYEVHKKGISSFGSFEVGPSDTYYYLGAFEVCPSKLKAIEFGMHAQRFAGIGPRVRFNAIHKDGFKLGLWATVLKDLESRHINYIMGLSCDLKEKH